MINLDDVAFYGDATLDSSGSSAFNLHAPCNSSSIIQQLVITANNVTLCSIDNYNLIHNTLMDFENAELLKMMIMKWDKY